MFIAVLVYKVPIEEVEKHLNEHVEFLKEQYEAGNFIASGRKVPRTGGVILSNMDSKEELEKILSQDPFHINDVADYEIVEFVPTMTSKELEFLKQR
ncbi:YciI family protein [Prolixibacter sp. NT017]|uniref:YciI family protein n=1 Tax=Prolixibacter sp. NT017 TaxID=2652390 RepID=UPI00126BE658|nr:YciI family protein [Prolixibacter sp. NT017]GET24521.1 hypothetical protein NT017_08500 [Prolixibacter sp. NT017]